MKNMVVLMVVIYLTSIVFLGWRIGELFSAIEGELKAHVLEVSDEIQSGRSQ